jgi:hypothetical protein
MVFNSFNLVFLIGSKFKTKMAKTETFNLNENLLIDYDYDGLDDMEVGSFEDIKPMVGSISTLNAPSGSKNITILDILDIETKVAWKLLKTQLTLNWKAWVPYHTFSFLWHFFILNDHSRLDHV